LLPSSAGKANFKRVALGGRESRKKLEDFSLGGSYTYEEPDRGEIPMANAPLATVLRQLHQLAARRPQGETDRELLRRFATAQDRLAFEALVRRHGPLVLGVCRRVLRQEQDAEDACQATFLVLARKAASIRNSRAIVSWLYGVAYRTARDVKRAARRRRAHEARSPTTQPADPSWVAAWREVQTVLDDEIGRLPDRLRAPFLLCHLEGQSRAEAARQLGLPEGTIWSRLAQARDLLRGRLSRRGITLSAVLAAAGLTGSTQATTLPAELLTCTARAAAALARGRAPDISERVVTLVERGVRATALVRLKMGLALTLMAGLLVAGATVLAFPRSAPDRAAMVPAESGQGNESVRPATDRFGDPLPPGALARLGTLRLRHKEGCTCVTFTLDGRQLITAADDGSVRFWDLDGGREMLTLRAAEHRVSGLALSPDGKVLATADGNVVRLWDAKIGRELLKLPCESDGNDSTPLVFTADSATLAVVAKDGSIRLHQAATGKERQTLPPQSKRARCLAFTADGKGLVSVCEDGKAVTLRVWDLSSGQRIQEVAIQSPGSIRIRPLALSSDGRTLAVECATLERVKNPGGGLTVFTQYRLCLWDVAKGRERLRTEGEQDVLWAAAFSVDGKSVATAGMGPCVRVWDTMTGQLRVALENPPGGSRPDAQSTLAFSPDGKRVASVGDSAAAHVWDLATRGVVAGLPEGHHAAVSAVAYAPDGRTLASAGEDHTIRVWDTASGRPRRLLKGHSAAVRALTYAPDGRALASADIEGTLRVWDSATGKALHTISAVPQTVGFYSGICPLAYVPDGKRLVSWGDDHHFRFWAASTGKGGLSRPLVLSGIPPQGEVRPEKMPSEETRVQKVRFSADGQTAAVAVGGTLYLVDVVTGQELFKLAGHNGPCCLAFSPDGRTLASGGWDKKVRLWDVTTGQELLRIEGLDFVNAVAVGPDSRTVAVATGWANGEVCLFDLRTGAPLLRLRGHGSYTGALAFSPDGKTLASGQRDTTVLVWDLAPGLQRLGLPKHELSREELMTYWEQLGSSDAKKGRAAVEALGAAPGVALPFLKSRLRPIEWVKPEHIQRLIARLDSDDFATRKAAAKELAVLGEEAEPALRRALAGPLSAEAKRRVEALLAGPAPREVPTGELLRRLRATHVLEQIGSPETVRILLELAVGAPSARETLEAKTASERLSHRATRP
jgi:RNA polymerase sigma factor (sigma-70 family)